MLLVQVNDKAAYFRRLKILNVSLNSKSDAKYIWNTYALLFLTNNTELFDHQFL